MDQILAPWPWFVVGPLITLVMFIMLYFGRTFAISSSLRTVCAIGGAGKIAGFFKYDWRSQIWNLVFIGGTIIGGFIASNYLSDDSHIILSRSTIETLADWSISEPTKALVPTEIFSWDSLFTLNGIIFMILGGFLVGFGARYAGGCTSGHAISGLSNLQVPSLIAVVGFFIGGMITTYFLLPFILG
jgi:uncharacterized membrane protein YedE/YeeE